MIIYLVGISCVGKTTIGRMLAEKLDFSFYDLDLIIGRKYQVLNTRACPVSLPA
jgi:shikimate kinase